VPPLTADILDQFFGRVPTVELHIYLPAFGQEWAQCFQYLTGNTVFAAKWNAFFFGSFPIETTYCSFPQVKLQIDGGYVLTDP
jgi:cytochrome c biogenesis protein ResB